ncbi:MAG: HAMP domain-containing sensor histidine kinase, partial [Campylobacterota bacterium]|nr:HAMP domain-containing sensor histidine kinase [Campylobacterota bacterium]
NKSLDTITKQQHDNIYNKWVNPVVKEKFTDYTLLWQVLIVILFIILAMLYNRFTLKKLNFKLKKEVEAKTKDLKDINKTLEVKIKEEVQKNRKKDALIHEQTKLASMGEMIGNIAHQWRQPLSVISTASSGMQIQKEYDMLTDEIFKESCEAINKNSQYLSKTIDEFRDYIKGDLDIIDFNLKEQNNKFLQLINSDIIKYNINMILDCKEDINIKGYPNNLIECLIHIFNNAKEALVENNKENERYIFISQEIIKNNVIIIIKDNAGGIDESIIHKIFEPYFTTKHQAQGTGLGLHMCYNSIVNNPKGTLDTQNINYFYHGKKYKGAEFKITIPLQVKI